MLQILRADSLIAVGSLLVMLTWLRKTPLSRPAGAWDGSVRRASGQTADALTGFRAKAGAVFGFLLLFYPITAAFGAMWTAILLFTAEDLCGSLPHAAYVVRPEPYLAVWFMPGLLLGILCGVAVIDLSLGALMGRPYYEHPSLWGVAAGNTGQRSRHGLAFFSLLLLPLILGYVTLFMPWNARFEEERVVIHDLYALREQVYSYDDIDLVAKVSHDVGPSGAARPHPMIYLFFRDGRRWCDEDYGTRPSDCRGADEAFLAFLCERSGRPLTQAKFIEDVTGSKSP